MAQENPYRPQRPTQPGMAVKKKSSVGWCILWFFIGMLIPIGAIGIAAGLVPIGTILNMVGLQDAVSSNISGKSILGLVNYVPEMTVGDVPYLQTVVNNALSNSGFGKYVDIDWSKLQSVKFTSSTLSSEIGNALTLNVSLENLEADNFVTLDPKLKQIPCFSQWVEAGEVDTTSSDFVPAMYYYDTTEDDGNADNAYYTRAFKDNGEYVEGASSATKLYLVNMYEANLLDCVSVMASRLSAEKAGSIINAFSYSVPENSLIDKLVGERTIGQLAEINADEILLSDIIDSTEENQQMRDVISSWMGKSWEEVTLANLTDGSQPITNIKLSVIIDKDDPGTNTQLVDIIESMINDTKWEDITIGQLTSSEYSTDNIKLSIVLPKGQEGTNQEFVNVIESMINDKKYEEITLGDLMSDQYSFQNVKLDAVMPKADVDPSMVSTLESVTKKTYEEITVNDLQQADINELALSAVIEYDPANPNPLYDVLCDITGITDPEALTVGDLSTIESFNGLHLTTVIEYDPTNPNPLYDVLLDLNGTTDPYGLTVGELGSIESFDGLHLVTVLDSESALFPILIDLVGPDAQGNPATSDTITIGDLSNIRDFGELHLSTVMDPYDPTTKEVTDFYKILMDVTSTSQPEDITITSLEQADFGLIRLSRVLPYEQNKNLYDILLEATGTTSAEALTVNDLSNFSMDDVKLVTVMQETSENTSFYNILRDMTGATSNDQITISSLSTANPQNIEVFSVLDHASVQVQDSSFLRALYAYDPHVKVSNLGTALNNLPLSDVYGGVCWTKDSTQAVNGDVYTYSATTDATGKVVETYTYNYETPTTLGENDWYISKEAGCWLIFCNDITYDIDTTNPTGYEVMGRPIIVTQDNDFTLAKMETESSQTANKITHTTINTLILTELMTEPTTGYSNEIKAMTIENMIAYVDYWMNIVGPIPTN